MTDGEQSRVACVSAQPFQQERNRVVVAERFARRPAPVVDDLAPLPFDLKARVGVDLFELAASDGVELAVAHRECMKLDAGRSRINDQNDIHA